MDVQLSEEQTMLQDSVRKFVENEVPVEKVRELADNPKGLTDELWNAMAEQGWLGIIVPEELGGLDMGAQALGLVAYELGRGVVPSPFLSTTMAINMIVEGGTDGAKEKYMEKLVDGSTIGTVAVVEPQVYRNLNGTKCTATADDDGFLLNGKKDVVPDAVAAGLFVVAADTGSGIGFFLVDADAAGVSVAGNTIYDLSNRNGTLRLDNVKVSADAVIQNPDDAYRKTLHIANVILAGDSLGGTEFIHRLTIGYAKERTQFGILIGTFQAVKHPLVDMFAQIESAKSAFYYAAWAVDADSEDMEQAVAVARNANTEAYRNTTLTCLQLHGGIGFTWEYDLHIYLKRAKHNQFLYGDAHDYDEIICKEALGI